MELLTVVNRARHDYLNWRLELSIPWKLVMLLGMVGLTGLLAQVRLPLPFSPVPVTGQTLAVLLAGVLLGRWWGGVSMALYVGIGVAGVTWFAPQAGMPVFSAGGIGHLVGPTGGYLLGFILAALFLGHFIDKNIRSRGFAGMLGLMFFASFGLIYVPGLIWLGLWLNLVTGSSMGLVALLGMGAVPFIIGDISKAVLAAAIARGVSPKSS